MNYYERIQETIDFMEDNLENEIKVETIAKQIFMSESGFYRMFFAIAGFQVKDYFIRYIESNDNYSFGTQPFMEEYIIKKPEINRETQVVQHMPVIKIHS